MATETQTKTKRRQVRDCACGCGQKTRGGEFLPGHDAKLKSQLVAKIQGGTPNEKRSARAVLRRRGWEL